jgi:hypothetical protein
MDIDTAKAILYPYSSITEYDKEAAEINKTKSSSPSDLAMVHALLATATLMAKDDPVLCSFLESIKAKVRGML